jgi:hypothetical protein
MDSDGSSSSLSLSGHARVAAKVAIIVAHRSHAQALADGEVSIGSYPHLEDGRLSSFILSAIHAAVSKDVDPWLPDRGDPEAEGGDHGWKVWRLSDDLTMALAMMDVSRKSQVMTRLQAASAMVAYGPEPARIGALLDELSRLAQEATKLGRELLVRAK